MISPRKEKLEILQLKVYKSWNLWLKWMSPQGVRKYAFTALKKKDNIRNYTY